MKDSCGKLISLSMRDLLYQGLLHSPGSRKLPEGSRDIIMDPELLVTRTELEGLVTKGPNQNTALQIPSMIVDFSKRVPSTQGCRSPEVDPDFVPVGVPNSNSSEPQGMLLGPGNSPRGYSVASKPLFQSGHFFSLDLASSAALGLR